MEDELMNPLLEILNLGSSNPAGTSGLGESEYSGRA